MSRRERGVVLPIVLVVILLLVTGFATFLRRAMVDTQIARNRDAVAEAEAVARGGVQLGIALLLEDLIQEQQLAQGSGKPRPADEPAPIAGDTFHDAWAEVSGQDVLIRDGVVMRLRIVDAGSKFNLNSLIDYSKDPGHEVSEDAIEILTNLFTRVIDDMPIAPGQKIWSGAERDLARDLLAYMDPDDEPELGGAEDEYYQTLDPPRSAANRPLLSVDELKLVRGFDATLVDGLRPYVTVYPLVPPPGQGVNLNTAPPHVIATLKYGGAEGRNFDEDAVSRIMSLREDGKLLCDDTAADPSGNCVSPASEGWDGITPPTKLPAKANVFEVTAEVRIGEIRRSVRAVVDRSVPGDVRLLSWRAL